MYTRENSCVEDTLARSRAAHARLALPPPLPPPYTEEELMGSYHRTTLADEEWPFRLEGKAEGSFLLRKVSDRKHAYSVMYRCQEEVRECIVEWRPFAVVPGFCVTYMREQKRKSLNCSISSSLYELLLVYQHVFKHPVLSKVKHDLYTDIAIDDQYELPAQLPLELFLQIFMFLDMSSLAAFSMTCKALFVLSKEETLWKGLYISRFGHRVPPCFLKKDNLDWRVKCYFESTQYWASEPTIHRHDVVPSVHDLTLFGYHPTENDTIAHLKACKEGWGRGRDTRRYQNHCRVLQQRYRRVQSPAVGYIARSAALPFRLEDVSRTLSQLAFNPPPATTAEVELRKAALKHPSIRLISLKDEDDSGMNFMTKRDLFQSGVQHISALELEGSNVEHFLLLLLLEIPLKLIGALRSLTITTGDKIPSIKRFHQWLSDPQQPLTSLTIKLLPHNAEDVPVLLRGLKAASHLKLLMMDLQLQSLKSIEDIIPCLKDLCHIPSVVLLSIPESINEEAHNLLQGLENITLQPLLFF